MSLNLISKSDRMNKLSEHVDQLDEQIKTNSSLLKNAQLKIEEDQR